MTLHNKKNAILGTVLAGTLAFGGAASAQTAVTTGSVNFRTAPSVSSTVVGTVPKGDQVEVLNVLNDYWSKVTYDYKGKTYTGYISNDYYKTLDESTNNSSSNTTSTTSSNTANSITSNGATSTSSTRDAKTIGYVNFRTGPSLDNKIIGMIPYGEPIKIIKEINSEWSYGIYNYKGKDYYGYLSNRFFQYDGQASTSSTSGTQSSTSVESNSSSISDQPTKLTSETWEKKADSIISTGLNYWGTEYKFGADYEKDGSYKFDCSSFTQRVYKENGINLYRSSRGQATQGTYVKRSDIRKGDLAFFATQGDYVNGEPRIDHVAIVKDVKADGSIQLLHTYKVGVGVTTSTMYPNKGYWNDTFLFAKRVVK